MEIFILIISLLFFGKFLRIIDAFPENTSQVLNQFVIYVSLPALVLLTVPKLEFTADLIITAVVPWIVLFFSAALLILFSNIFKWPRNTLGALLLIVPLGNTSFIGVPMVRAFYGDDPVVYALIYDQLGTFLALAIYGSVVLALFNKDNKFEVKHISGKDILVKIILFPPFISLVIAIFLHFIDLPIIYFQLLKPIAMTLLPVVMIAVGFQLVLKIEYDKIMPFIVGLSIKMFIAPALVLLLFILIGFKGTIYQVTVFEAAMPPMITAGALAIMAGLSPKLTASMLAYGLLLSFISLPFFYAVANAFL